MNTDLPASAFAGCGISFGRYCCGQEGVLCVVCSVRRTSPHDTTLVKSTRPATCAVCREVVTGSIELPTGEHVCGRCCCIALRNMIDDSKERTDK